MKKRIVAAVALLAAALLSGCAMRTVDAMYAIPKRSAEYKNLQSAIDSAMYGLTYSAPVSGEHQQSVQMADLDGDGLEEYLVFAQGNSDKALQILIFRQTEDGICSLDSVIECTGSAFERVEYVQMDDQPGFELVVGRRVSDQIPRSLAVYSFSQGDPELLMMVGYSRFLTCDLDENGLGELLVLLPGDINGGKSAAVLYSTEDGSVERSVEVAMSEDSSRIKRMSLGTLQDGSPAVFLSVQTDENTITTDVFAVQNGRFTNITGGQEMDTAIKTLRNYYVYAEDIDKDGIMELPELVSTKKLSGSADDQQKCLIRWFSMDIQGREVDKLYTFHNYLGGWYLELEGVWAPRVTVEQNGAVYTFYAWDESYREANRLFSVTALTGANREEAATTEGRFALLRSEGVVYAGRLEEDAFVYDITEEKIINSFRLIQQAWKTGET